MSKLFKKIIFTNERFKLTNEKYKGSFSYINKKKT